MSSPTQLNDSGTFPLTVRVKEQGLRDEKVRMDAFGDHLQSHAVRGGILGLALGTAVLWLGHQKVPFIRSLTLPYKFFLGSSFGMAGFAIAGEQATFNAPYSRYAYAKQLEEQAYPIAPAIVTSPYFTRVTDWVLERKYQVTIGLWFAVMGGSFYKLHQNKSVPFNQKLVQARVYAQGAVIAALLATVALQSFSSNPDASEHHFARFSPGIHYYPWEKKPDESLKVKSPEEQTHE